MDITRDVVLNVKCPMLDEPDVVEWLLYSGDAPLCYPKNVHEDPGLRAVILAYDGGEGPHAPWTDDPTVPQMPQRLWDFVCEVAKEAGYADSYCYIRLNPVEV